MVGSPPSPQVVFETRRAGSGLLPAQFASSALASVGALSTTPGGSVEHKPSTAADVKPGPHAVRRSRTPARAALTPAQSHAERRSAPLTREQFKSLRRLAEQGVSPLRHL